MDLGLLLLLLLCCKLSKEYVFFVRWDQKNILRVKIYVRL